MLTGHRPDPLDPSDWRYQDHPERLGAKASDDVAREIDLRELFPPIRNQIAQNCTAHAVAAMLAANAKVRGLDVDPSVLFLYAIAILEEAPRRPLIDIGSGIRFMFRGMKGRGVTAEARWPELAENINVVPPDDAFIAAEENVIGDYYAIADGAEGPADAIAALKNGRPFSCAMVVNEAFAATRRGVYDGQGGKVIGPHCMVCVGYVPPPVDAFRLRNSWGPDAHEDGYVLISRRVFALHTNSKWALVDGVRAVR